MKDSSELDKRSATTNLLNRLERDYSFECEAGPLGLCAEWIALRALIESAKTTHIPVPDSVGDAVRAEWLADKIPALGDYAKEAADFLRRYASLVRSVVAFKKIGDLCRRRSGEVYFAQTADVIPLEVHGSITVFMKDENAASPAAKAREIPTGWREVVANLRLGLAAGSRSRSNNAFEMEYGGALLDAVEDGLSALEPRRCTCYVLPHADDCGLFIGITQSGERAFADELAPASTASPDLAAALNESLRSGLLFGVYEEPLDAYGKRIVRVIVDAIERSAGASSAITQQDSDTPGGLNRDVSAGTSHSEPDGSATKPASISNSQDGASQGAAPIPSASPTTASSELETLLRKRLTAYEYEMLFKPFVSSLRTLRNRAQGVPLMSEPAEFSGPQAAYDDFRKKAEIPHQVERWTRLAFMAGVVWTTARQRFLGTKIAKTAERYLP